MVLFRWRSVLITCSSWAVMINLRSDLFPLLAVDELRTRARFRCGCGLFYRRVFRHSVPEFWVVGSRAYAACRIKVNLVYRLDKNDAKACNLRYWAYRLLCLRVDVLVGPLVRPARAGGIHCMAKFDRVQTASVGSVTLRGSLTCFGLVDVRAIAVVLRHPRHRGFTANRHGSSRHRGWYGTGYLDMHVTKHAHLLGLALPAQLLFAGCSSGTRAGTCALQGISALGVSISRMKHRELLGFLCLLMGEDVVGLRIPARISYGPVLVTLCWWLCCWSELGARCLRSSTTLGCN